MCPRLPLSKVAAEQFVWFVVLTVLGLVSTSRLHAQTDDRNWFDERVMPRFHDVSLHIDDPGARVQPSALSIYRVVKTNGSKVWLESEETPTRTGWVYCDQVVAVGAARDFFSEQIRLNPRDTYPFLMRAPLWYNDSEFDHAIAEFNEAIRLDPKNIWARANRGHYWLLKKDLAKAAAEFDTACQLDPKNTDSIYQKSVYLFVTYRQGALTGMKTVLDLEGWRDDLSCYAVLMSYFAAIRDGSALKATAVLDDAGRRCDTSAWPYPIIKHLRGEIDEAKLMAAATDDDRMTEVRCFLGLRALQEAKQDAARGHFRWVTEHGNASFTQYAISLIELDRIEND